MGMRTRSGMALLGWALALTSAAFASGEPAWSQGELQWSAIGPGGGAAYSLAAGAGRRGTLFAGMYGSGVWKTADGGATWQLALPEDSFAYPVAATPADPPAVYFGAREGVWRSADG